MEVGAVKQAFNNEVILLKKNLNQAKVQVIHKLTRKAKTLTEKKAPEHLKENLKRKAESAVNEVLIMKKIKARDIAKFIITHTGQVSDYLNRPKVDNDKACARLVLHKSLQDKYKFFRSRFGNIPIKDLFMSRSERIKLKKEAKEQEKNKKKGRKGKVTNSAGNWDVEDVAMDDSKVSDNKIDSEGEISDGSKHSEEEIISSGDVNDTLDNSDDNEKSNSLRQLLVKEMSDDEAIKSNESDDELENNSDNDGSEYKHNEKLTKHKPNNKIKSSIDKIDSDFDVDMSAKPIKVKENKKGKKVKENKNKNLKEKLENRKFKKENDDANAAGNKVVDSFFMTATGENYLSLAEPRQPDEVKDVHKQGNRQERRAAMFGRNFKPRNKLRENNFRSNQFNEGHGRNSGERNKNDKFSSSEDFNGSKSKFNDKNVKFNDRNNKFNNKNNSFNSTKDDQTKEKLHPSWEAKRKLKSMSLLPSQGKKTVFNDN